MFKRFLLILSFLLISGVGCANCSFMNTDTPNIRTISGIEKCPDLCVHLTNMKCDDYIKVIDMPLEDGGTQKMNCTEFCQYEMSNSIDIRPDCVLSTQNCTEVATKCGW